MLDDNNIIQCYSPNVHHNPQALVINDKARQELIKALQEKKEITVIDAMTTDGEGFYFTLIISDAEKIDKTYKLPYLERYALGQLKGLKNPVYESYVLKGHIKENTSYTEEDDSPE